MSTNHDRWLRLNGRVNVWSLTAQAPALAGAFGPVLFIIITMVAHLVPKQYDAVRQTISELALGAYGWIQVSAFVLLACLIIVLAAGLRRNIGGKHRINAACVQLTLIGVGFLLISIFPTDIQGTPLTAQNLVHQVTVRAMAALFPSACFVFAHGLVSKKHWQSMIPYTLFTGAMATILGILWLVAPDMLYSHLGLYERIIATNALVWMEVMAIRLLVVSRTTRY